MGGWILSYFNQLIDLNMNKLLLKFFIYII
jgi:hypothetical protein